MIYFDNAATSYPKPPTVKRAITRVLTRAGGNPGRSSHKLSLAAAEAVDNTRCELADLIGAPDPSHIVFTLNATYALNLALRTRVKRGSHILISDREHNAVYRPVCRLLRDGIAEFDVFSTRGNVRAHIEALLRPETDILICNHVSNVDGNVAPIAEIGRICRERGIYFILDASQSIGHMPFSIRDGEPDAICAPGHKGLFGIQGCGFAWLRQGEGLSTFVEGGSGSHSSDPQMPSSLPERMEAGTLPTPAIAALGAGVRFVRERTPEWIAETEGRLLRRLQDRLAAIRGVSLYTAESGSVCSFTCDGMTPDRLTQLLDRRDICVRGGLHCAPLAHAALGTQRTGTVRVSLGCMNTEKEIDAFAGVLRTAIETKGTD